MFTLVGASHTKFFNSFVNLSYRKNSAYSYKLLHTFKTDDGQNFVTNGRRNLCRSSASSVYLCNFLPEFFFVHNLTQNHDFNRFSNMTAIRTTQHLFDLTPTSQPVLAALLNNELQTKIPTLSSTVCWRWVNPQYSPHRYLYY